MTDSSTKPDHNAESSSRKEMLKRSLLKIRKLQTQLEASEQAKREPIAIVGMSCRYPGSANSPEAFWQLLRDGVDAIGDVPPDRWCAEDYYDPDPAAVGKAYVMQGGYLDDVESFDAPFFEISPTEAAQVDPQQRLLLQVTWEALEHAGLPANRLAGTRTGVYVGLTANDFLLLNTDGGSYDIDTYLASGTSHAVAAGRLSYFLGLEGPAMTIDTACSAALLAVHQACQSLRTGESQTALAGGALLILSPFGHIAACKGGMLSPAGRCKTFDASADGYVRAEGVAMVVLKRLQDAEADGDRILAVIRGTASNQDGRSGGLTAPNGKSQEAVIRQALADAGVVPAEIAYVETHGTGTSLGDPIEVQALGAVHSGQRDTDKPLLIGSVKSNIGHTEALAGVAGLMKVVLALQHREIPPHLNCSVPNPYISWSDYPIEVASELTDWPQWAERRLAGLSSFGFSGTNVHMIIEEAPRRPAPEIVAQRPLQILTLSARSEAALSDLASAFRNRLCEDGPVSVEDFCYTANTGRSHFEFRRAIVAASRNEIADALTAIAGSEEDPRVHPGKTQPNRQPMLAFVFPGEAPELFQVGRDLYDTQKTFRQALDECDALFSQHLGKPLLPLLYPTVEKRAASQEQLAEPRFAQPALFAFEFALANLWQSWGVRPSMALGYGVGEITAACVAGVISIADAMDIAVERGQLTQEFPDGQPPAAALKTLGSKLSNVRITSPRVELISPITGETANIRDLSSAAYWQDQTSASCHAGDVADLLLTQGSQAVVEIGVGLSLRDSTSRSLTGSTAPWFPTSENGKDEWQQMLATLASLYALGVVVDWEAFDRDFQRQRVELPTYPFAQVRYPIRTYDTACRDEVKLPDSIAGPTGSTDIDDWFYELAWRPAERAAAVDTAESNGQETGAWLVFGDQQGVGNSLRDLLKVRGADVYYIQAGERFERMSDRNFCLRPDQPQDYERLVGEVLGPKQISCRGIAHLWSLDAAPTDAISTQQLAQSQSLVSASVLLLIHALSVTQGHQCPRLWLATRGAQAIEMSDRALSLTQAPLWGLGRTIAAEHAELWGGLIDIDPASPVPEAAGTLCDEILAFDNEDQTVHRGGIRYVPQLARVGELAQFGGRVECRPDRSYLITGGLGGLGIEAARWLIQRGARHLILLGRTTLPARREWASVDESGGVAQKIAAVRELELLGAAIHPIAVDVANSDALSGFLEEYRREGRPPIAGVLHAAGTVEYGSLLEHDVEKLDAVMRAKLLGGWSLHRCFEDAELEFFVLFSSAASIMNSPMLGGYAAANASLDALAHYRRSQGLAGVCVNWGSWGEVGMATQHDVGDRVTGSVDTASISPAQGFDALERIILSASTQVIVMPIDWQDLSHLYSGLSRSSIFDALAEGRPGSTSSSDQQALLQLADGEDHGIRLRDYLRDNVGGLLGVAEQDLDNEKPISQLGFDSLMAVQLKNKIQKEFGVVLPMATLLAGPTIAELGSTLLGESSTLARTGNAVIDTAADDDSEEGEL